ncbi:hypothetical protein Pmani_025076 [Petrolisthes manimaculis]|uniref:Pentraxin (PTX) domain-containing protein n=1 Tax=Petrolisthes manimaculis TaxID=1843537 RepID=A0AAE1TY00_9EUCA|nr:hypothetical protein Pmani_025076 [Petrolisthes manimaculis]
MSTTLKETVQPYRWYHMCIRLDAGRLSLHLDGNNNILKDMKQDTPSPPLPLNGTIVIGNDQDSLGGGFAKAHSYFGAVSGFTIWDQSLSQQQMVDLFNYYLYYGKETTLEYVLKYQSNLLCFFYLDYYPFDSQTCSIDLKVTNAPNELITYHYLESATTIQLSQLNSLAEFYVDGLQLSSLNPERFTDSTSGLSLLRKFP